ncbi:MAG: phage tail protein [Candidatus Accumulibacter sp.]|jgi:phage protein U|nr:phage tail protein [Accumulibacter sp.]
MIPIGNYGTDTAAQVIHDLTRSRGGVSMHVLLGDIAFDLVTYFEGIEENFSANFAEHPLIEGKPRLQWIGDNLDEITWHMVLHAGFCQPALEMLKVKAAIARHEALPLIFANGDYKGHFVPTDMRVTTKQLTRDGTLVWVETDLTLREYVLPVVLVEETPRQEPVAAEKPGTSGAAALPAQTVNTEPPPRPADAPPVRTEDRRQ